MRHCRKSFSHNDMRGSSQWQSFDACLKGGCRFLRKGGEEKKREPKLSRRELEGGSPCHPERWWVYLALDARLDAFKGLIFICCEVKGALTWVAKLQCPVFHLMLGLG